jgi:hypothetical protein
MKYASVVALGCLLANCGRATSGGKDASTTGTPNSDARTATTDAEFAGSGVGGGSGGSGGSSGSNMCYVDFPCYVTNQGYRCSSDGQHYQSYEEVSCNSVCGSRPCSGGGCQLGETLRQCPEGRTCRPSQDIGPGEPCSGRVDAGGAAPDAGQDAAAAVACTDDRLLGLPAAARPCARDSDCAIVFGSRCCGPIPAFGEARTQAAAYEACLHLDRGACSGLNCSSYREYITDTGRLTPEEAWDSFDEWISVSCVDGLCTTDVVVPQDAGVDQLSSDGPADL